MIAITANRLYTPLETVERPLLLIDGSIIAEVSSQSVREVPRSARLLDLGDAFLSPGFVDIHIHGGAGHDVMENGASALPAVETLLAAHGVTSYFPTTVTAPMDQILAALERLANAIESSEKSSDGKRSKPLGIHLEGPFISYARRGVHPPANLLRPSVETFDRFWQAAGGHIRVMTIAAELDGAKEVIAEAVRRGVCVSLGHTDADWNATRAGIAAGARHATHAFNAMRPLDHREPGIVGEMLANPQLSADIIVDGIHVHPAVVKLFLKAKGADEAVLITDATAATGMPDGRYRLGSLEVEVRNGKCMSEGKLAGSVLTMDRAVRNVMEFAEWEMAAALRLASLNPAKVVGLTDRGKIEAGRRADIVALNPAGGVKATIIGGVVE